MIAYIYDVCSHVIGVMTSSILGKGWIDMRIKIGNMELFAHSDTFVLRIGSYEYRLGADEDNDGLDDFLQDMDPYLVFSNVEFYLEIHDDDNIKITRHLNDVFEWDERLYNSIRRLVDYARVEIQLKDAMNRLGTS